MRGKFAADLRKALIPLQALNGCAATVCGVVQSCCPRMSSSRSAQTATWSEYLGGV